MRGLRAMSATACSLLFGGAEVGDDVGIMQVDGDHVLAVGTQLLGGGGAHARRLTGDDDGPHAGRTSTSFTSGSSRSHRDW